MEQYADGMYYGANVWLIKKAQELRQNPTPAESAFWQLVSNKKFGVKFRRQHPIYDFIVDFYCHNHVIGQSPWNDKRNEKQ